MKTNNTILFSENNFHCASPHNITENEWIFYYNFVWCVEGFGSVLTGCLGITFNIITIFVLLKSELAASFFNWLLVSLSILESLFLICGILEAFRSHIGSTNLHNYLFVVFFYPFRSVLMCCSIYTTIMLALERYNALVNPTHHQVTIGLTRPSAGRHSLKVYFNWHWNRLLKYIGPIILFSTIFYIPKWLELDVNYHKLCNGSTSIQNHSLTNVSKCVSAYDISITDLRTDNHYNLWYINLFNIIITAVIPLVMLTYLNVNICIKLKAYIERQPLPKIELLNTTRGGGNITHSREIKNKREKDMIQQARILYSIVILFGMFHILRIVLNIEEFVTLERRKVVEGRGCVWLQYWTIIAAPVSHLLLQINSSVNFVIYCCFNKSFRIELCSLLTSCFNILKFKTNSRTQSININDPISNINNPPPIHQSL